MNAQVLRAYHGDPAIKAKYLDRVRAHAAADALTQGVGWKNGKGCAIGCTLEAYDHSRYPIELGLPEWLARLEDAIFEGLSHAEAMTWPESFLEAIHPGADLEPVRHKLALRRIDRLIALQNSSAGKHGEAIDAVIAQTVAALQQVRRCHEAEVGGDVCDVSARSAAASAAESAAWSAARSAAASAASSASESAWSAWSAARSAAESAAWSASASAWSAAWSASESAWSAARSAWSAAWSASESAWSAARSAAWRQEASDLLEMLREVTP